MPQAKSEETSNDKNSKPDSDKQNDESKNKENISEDKIEEDKEVTKDSEHESKETGEEKKEQLKELSKEDILKILKSFNGVGQVVGERIYDAGFDSREKLQTMTSDDLKKIRGIGKSGK